MKHKWDFRDISVGLKMLREFLLGRKHEIDNLHGRFGPRISPRSIPPPDIPRGPIYKYSDQYYCKRNVMDSVKPPVMATLYDETGTTNRTGNVKPLSFKCAPTPGCAWWWDGHCYYDLEPLKPKVAKPLPPCPPPKTPPEPAPPAPCKPEPKTKCQKTCSN